MSPKPSAFLEAIIACLLPSFTEATADILDARAEIIETLAAYATRTRAEVLTAAQIIAFGLATLDVLAEARTADLSSTMRLRYRSCANGLNRAALATEKSLDRRLACDIPGGLEATRPQAKRQPEPTADRLSKQIWAGATLSTLKRMGYPPIQPAAS